MDFVETRLFEKNGKSTLEHLATGKDKTAKPAVGIVIYGSAGVALLHLESIRKHPNVKVLIQ